ncbi:MAG: MFS transporter [Planctomycetota bacterium]
MKVWWRFVRSIFFNFRTPPAEKFAQSFFMFRITDWCRIRYPKIELKRTFALCAKIICPCVYGIGAALFAISASWSALATSYMEFVIARIIGGVGVGGAILIAPIYIAEIAPPKLRGSLVSFNQLNIVIGISVAYFSNYFLVNIEGESWRWMLGVEALPAVIYFIGLFTVPRSPRWLIRKLNKVALARKILTRIGGEAYAEYTIEEIQQGLSKKESKAKLSDLFKSKYATIMTIALGIAFFQQITGINAVFYYAPTIFEQAGGSTDSSFLQAIVVGLTNLVFTFVAIWLIDKLGRKPLLLIGTSCIVHLHR